MARWLRHRWVNCQRAYQAMKAASTWRCVDWPVSICQYRPWRRLTCRISSRPADSGSAEELDPRAAAGVVAGPAQPTRPELWSRRAAAACFDGAQRPPRGGMVIKIKRSGEIRCWVLAPAGRQLHHPRCARRRRCRPGRYRAGRTRNVKPGWRAGIAPRAQPGGR